MNIAAYGISADIPEHWEARFFRHGGGEPTLHAASFPLPHSDGEFGSRATARMPGEGLFLSLTEYSVGDGISIERGLFAHPLPRSVDVRTFSSRSLLRHRQGQRGTQRFFSAAGRAFCLYVVIAGHTSARRRVGDLDRVLRTLEVVPL
jgi:hypothetical protein